MRQPDSAYLTSPRLRIDGADAMRSLGRALGRALLLPSDGALVVSIQGDLGAGKTTLVSGVLNGMEIGGTARSPTYTLIEPYETPSRRLFHLDLYRLADPLEVEPLGLRDLLTPDAALLIEWPERGAGRIPPADLLISIAYVQDAAGDLRDLTLAAASPGGERLLREMLNVQ